MKIISTNTINNKLYYLVETDSTKMTCNDCVFFTNLVCDINIIGSECTDYVGNSDIVHNVIYLNIKELRKLKLDKLNSI